ncbi:uncharacterized protein PV09_04885 [Verruconis gallopava]|uniref:VWFA domain-containing protein n=1 Tax=Verruconis gallopava TaxID=253628 RepID=A0A0D1YTU6_9PEZI|nr:uncharacterized protein PV09_04885 [Verruconis gallopava]KIW04067.1 hypothetical protein PV09_04885 [Verruconis gallopava]
MSSQYQRQPKGKVWPIEPKAPSLVSLSVRDQNVQRPRKRSSSLKVVALGLKKGLSSQHLLNSSAQESLKALRKGKHSSCSSLHVKKNRSRGLATHVSIAEVEHDEVLDYLSIDIKSSSITHTGPLGQVGDVSSHNLSERPQKRSPSGDLTDDTSHTALQTRKHSARQLISKVVGTMHKRKQSAELFHEDTKRVEAWIEKINAGVPPIDARHTNGSIEPYFHPGNSGERVTLINEQLLNHLDELPDEILFPEPVLAASTQQVPNVHPQNRQRSVSWPASGSMYGHEPWPLSLRLPVRLRVTAKAELDEATSTSNERLWAVVQIHVELPKFSSGTSHDNNAIAVAIVLDNSRLATRKDVKKMCLEIMSLAASLKEGVDHLGVYCTSASNITEICAISVAVPLSIPVLRSKLDEVSQRSRDSFRVQDAYIQAVQDLRAIRSHDEQMVPLIAEDIVIISSSCLGIAECFQQRLEGFRVHMVNPSLIPYSDKVRKQLVTTRATQLKHVRDSTYSHDNLEQEDNTVSGWLIDSTCCLASDCSSHRSHSLSDAILYSKSQANAGSVSNLSITINESDGAKIQEINGSLSYQTLLPGQMVSIPIRVQINPLDPRFSIGSNSEFGSSRHHSIVDAMSELELTLGNHLSELFEVHITYNHSFFPKSTRLEVRESCWLSRNLPSTTNEELDLQVRKDLSLLKRNPRVQKQLALCKAAAKPPAEALLDLEKVESETLSEGVKGFVDALKRRLRHRIALLGDPTFIDYLLSSDYLEKSRRTYNENITVEEYLKEVPNPLYTEDEKSLDTSTVFVWNHPRYSRSSAEADEGEARKIWQQIRRSSKWNKPSRMPNEKAGENGDKHVDTYDPQIEGILETALRHGRKISTATLRSIIRDLRRSSSLTDDGVSFEDFE